MKVRHAYVEKRRQMLYTHRQLPVALRNNLKAIVSLDSGIYYGRTGSLALSRYRPNWEK